MRILFSMILIFNVSLLTGQIVFQDESFSLTVLDQTWFNSPISHKEPVQESDPIFVKVFKEYFNPDGFNEYKSFFLSQDWGGFSLDEFTEWQMLLDSNALYLHQILYLRNLSGQEFFIGQYTLETSAYTIPQSVKFKKISGQWKHIHVRNDVIFPFLHKIGNVRPDKINAYARSTNEQINMNQLSPDLFSSVGEKFDRQKIFQRMEPMLKNKLVSDADLLIARNLFVSKADQSFIEFLCDQYPIDYIQLMEESNLVAGFQLFRYSKALKE